MTGVDPFLMGLFIFARAHKILHLHLLELARAKNEIARGHFVAKRLADLRDTERQFAPAGVEHVMEVYKDALRSFRTKIDERIGIVLGRRANVSLEHQVEMA